MLKLCQIPHSSLPQLNILNAVFLNIFITGGETILNIINDTVRFPEALGAGRVITKTYNTYPYAVYQASVALGGIDYGFSDTEGMFFRCTINTYSEIVSAYRVKVTITFGLRSQQFDKKTDATVNYTLLINATYKP